MAFFNVTVKESTRAESPLLESLIEPYFCVITLLCRSCRRRRRLSNMNIEFLISTKVLCLHVR